MPQFRIGDYEIAHRRRGTATALGFLAVGLGVGALATLLLAPKTGRQMRKDIRRRFEDARDALDDLGERASDLWDRREEFAGAARRKMEPIARNLRHG